MTTSSRGQMRTAQSLRKSLLLAIVAAAAAAVVAFYAPFFLPLLLAAVISGALSFGLEWLRSHYRKNLEWIGVGVGVFVFGILSRDLMPRDSVALAERSMVAAEYLAVWVLAYAVLQLVFRQSDKKAVNKDAA